MSNNDEYQYDYYTGNNIDDTYKLSDISDFQYSDNQTLTVSLSDSFAKGKSGGHKSNKSHKHCKSHKGGKSHKHCKSHKDGKGKGKGSKDNKYCASKGGKYCTENPPPPPSVCTTTVNNCKQTVSCTDKPDVVTTITTGSCAPAPVCKTLHTECKKTVKCEGKADVVTIKDKPQCKPKEECITTLTGCENTITCPGKKPVIEKDPFCVPSCKITGTCPKPPCEVTNTCPPPTDPTNRCIRTPWFRGFGICDFCIWFIQKVFIKTSDLKSKI